MGIFTTIVYAYGRKIPKWLSTDLILSQFGGDQDRTGCNLLLNTSFNCREPLVDTVEQARVTWKRAGLDVFVSPEGIEIKA